MCGRLMSRFLLFIAVLAMNSVVVVPAKATLRFYYDPLTGNVSFDTAETRSGGLLQYTFYYNGRDSNSPPSIFRPEEMVRLSGSSLYSATPIEITDSTATPWQGLFTIGDILPAGLSDETWTTTFVYTAYPARDTYCYVYTDQLGGGEPPPAEFIYGPPEGEFKNRWDLVDPDTLTWATTAKLIYRAWSGEVLIDTTGEDSGYTSMMVLTSDGAFLPGGYTPFTDSPYNYATEDGIFVTADAIEPGRYSIGQLLPTGLDRAEFEATFTNALFLGRAGFKAGSFDFETDGLPMSLVYVGVPEPSSFVLINVALLAGLWRARRTARFRRVA